MASGRRTSLQLGVGLRDEQTETVGTLDRSVTRIFGSIDRRLSSKLTAQLNAEYRIEDFGGANLPDADYQEYRFTLNRLIGRRVSIGATVARLERSDNGSMYEFSETRYGLRINYLLTDRRGSGEE
jgi:hypothetical protein